MTFSDTNIPFGTQIEVYDDAAHTHSVGTMVENAAHNGYELTGLTPKQYYIALKSTTDTYTAADGSTKPKAPLDNTADDVEVYVQRFIDSDILLTEAHLSITTPTADANVDGLVK